MLIQKGSDMSLNKHKIIPLIESYYHTFTPLEKNIADFFIHNTDEQDFSSKNISGILYVSEASLSRLPKNVVFTDTENLYTNISRILPLVLKKIFPILKYRNLILIRNFSINPMLCWIQHKFHGSLTFWYQNPEFMFMAEAAQDLPLKK